MKAEIKHDAGKRFFVIINGWECTLFYEKITEQLWDLKKTFIPAQLREMGISKELLKHEFHFMGKNNIRAKLSCTYAQLFKAFNGIYSNVLAN